MAAWEVVERDEKPEGIRRQRGEENKTKGKSLWGGMDRSAIYHAGEQRKFTENGGRRMDSGRYNAVTEAA